MIALLISTLAFSASGNYYNNSIRTMRDDLAPYVSYAAIAAPPVVPAVPVVSVGKIVSLKLPKKSLRQQFVGAAESCSTAADLAKNFVVSIDNDAPAKGENVTTVFDFDLDAPITGGTAYYSATLNGLGPFTSTAALCEETAKTNDPCPLAAGHHHEVSSAANTVTGKIVTTITWEDESGAQILCAKITVKSS